MKTGASPSLLDFFEALWPQKIANTEGDELGTSRFALIPRRDGQWRPWNCSFAARHSRILDRNDCGLSKRQTFGRRRRWPRLKSKDSAHQGVRVVQRRVSGLRSSRVFFANFSWAWKNGEGQISGIRYDDELGWWTWHIDQICGYLSFSGLHHHYSSSYYNLLLSFWLQ